MWVNILEKEKTLASPCCHLETQAKLAVWVTALHVMHSLQANYCKTVIAFLPPKFSQTTHFFHGLLCDLQYKLLFFQTTMSIDLFLILIPPKSVVWM